MGFSNGGLDEMFWLLILKNWTHYGENKNTNFARAKHFILCSLNLLVCGCSSLVTIVFMLCMSLKNAHNEIFYLFS